jgi:hypothetical protein
MFIIVIIIIIIIIIVIIIVIIIILMRGIGSQRDNISTVGNWRAAGK